MKSIEEKAKEAFVILGDKYFNLLKKTNPRGDFKHFVKMAVEYGFRHGYKAAQEWISVEDELPSEIGQYLVKKLHGQITIMHFHAPFDSGKRIFQWWGFGRWNDQHKQVTHWKPIE